jgi:hypothetical protein
MKVDKFGELYVLSHGRFEVAISTRISDWCPRRGLAFFRFPAGFWALGVRVCWNS